MRSLSLLGLLLVLSVGSAACGGGKPAESPKTETSADAESESTTRTSATAAPVKEEKPKPPSKFPAPFLEPDCATPAAEGYLPDAKKAVAEVRKKHWSELEACAEAAPPGEDVSGEIRTTFRLDPDGVPRCVEAPGAPSSMEEVTRCVLNVYRSFRFPKPKGGSVRVTDGIHLHVSHDEEE